jgi:general stress protein CsbA
LARNRFLLVLATSSLFFTHLVTLYRIALITGLVLILGAAIALSVGHLDEGNLIVVLGYFSLLAGFVMAAVKDRHKG